MEVDLKVIHAIRRAGFDLSQFAASDPAIMNAPGVTLPTDNPISLDEDEPTERTLELV